MVNRKIFLLVFALTIAPIFITSCATAPVDTLEAKNSQFTHGNIQLNIKKGITTQTEVLEKFGAPNMATTDGTGYEVWTYQKYATVVNSSTSGGYGTIIISGGSASSSRFEQSSRTMTLILKFDDNKKLIDFKSMTTNF